jgi:hypothetical protein
MTPLSPDLESQNRSCFSWRNAAQRALIEKTKFIASIVILNVVGIAGLYMGCMSLSTGPTSNLDLIISIALVAYGILVLPASCALAGITVGHYQNIEETYPHLENYQGSFSDFLGRLIIRHQFDVKTWTPYMRIFLKEFEPVLLDRYFLNKNIDTEEQKIAYFCRKLEKGCCFGYSMALLAKMKEHARSSSHELKNSIAMETVVYHQLTNAIFYGLARHAESRLYPVSYFMFQGDLDVQKTFNYSLKEMMEYSETWIEDIIASEDKEASTTSVDSESLCPAATPKDEIEKKDNQLGNYISPKKYYLNYCGFNSSRVYIHEMEEALNIAEMQKVDLLEQFEHAERAICQQALEHHLVDNMTIAGYISIQWPKKEERKAGAHAIFLQISDGYFRFYDSGSALTHFFEFETKELLADGIVTHMKSCWKSFDEGQFSMILVGIPHDDESLTTAL